MSAKKDNLILFLVSLPPLLYNEKAFSLRCFDVFRLKVKQKTHFVTSSAFIRTQSLYVFNFLCGINGNFFKKHLRAHQFSRRHWRLETLTEKEN